MKKKYLALLLTSVLAVSTFMTACGNKEVTSTTEDSVINTEENASSEEETTTEEPTTEEETTEETGTAEDETVENVIEDKTIEAMFNAVKDELGENYYPNMPLEKEYLEQIYGVPAGSYETFYGEAPMISANVDTLIVVKPAEGQTDTVVDALTSYRQSLIDDSFQYPKNVPVIQNSEVYTTGDYVVFMCLAGNIMTSDEPTEEEMAEAVKTTMERAKAVIEVAIEQN